jgi:Resolvase, N terminal domain
VPLPQSISQVAVSRILSHTACLESPLSAANETVIGMTAILDYARASTTGQDLDAQLAGLAAAGAEADRIFTDKLSGSAKTARPGSAAMLDYARAGDTVVVTAIDRFGRSVAEVTRTIAELSEHRILLRASRERSRHRHTNRPRCRGNHGYPRRLELELGCERRAASRESRRARQLPATTPHKLTVDRQEQLRRLAATGEPVRELADNTAHT